MKKAVIDQIIVWIFLFVSFVTIFFLIIDYSTVIRIKEKTDQLSNYGVRLKALGKTDQEISDGLNKIRSQYFKEIGVGDLDCVMDSDGAINPLEHKNYKVIFKSFVDVTTKTFETKHLSSIASTFNEIDNNDYTCTLQLYKAE